MPEPPPPLEEHEGPVTWEAGGEVTEPVRVGGPDPVYSVAAQMARFTGSVVLECVIGKDGTVESVKVVKPLPFGLTESATEAVRQWRFRPSTLNGKPVAVVYVLTVNFNLPKR